MDDTGHNAGFAHWAGAGGNTSGPVIAGNYHAVIDAHRGATVTPLPPGQLPRPARRPRIALLPARRQPAPLGRDAEIAALARALQTGGAVQLWGPRGCGKSTLLRHAARTLPPREDGVVFLDASHGEASDLAQELFEACYQTQGYAPARSELRQLMTGLRLTVYVDNAELTTEQLRELRDTAPDAAFVFASHDSTLLGDGTVLELAGLARESGQALLERALGRPLPENQRAAAAELWQAASGRPLLLLRAARLARTEPSGEVRLPAPAAVADLLPLLLDQLDAGPMVALHLLATLGNAEVAAAHVGALTNVPDPAAVCERLTELGLAEGTERGYRCVLDVAEALWRRGTPAFPADRLCDYFTRWAALPTTTPADLAAHAAVLERAVWLAEREERFDLAAALARAASPGLGRSLRFGVWGRVLGHGRGAAQRAGDSRALAYLTHEEGVRGLLLGQHAVAGALLGEALVLWRQLGDTDGAHAAAHAQRYASPPQAAGAGGNSLAGGGNTGAAGPHPAPVAGTPQGPAVTSGATPGAPPAGGWLPPAPAYGPHPGAGMTVPGPGVSPYGPSPLGPPVPPSGAGGTAPAGAATASAGTGAGFGGMVTLLVIGIVAAIVLGVVIVNSQSGSSDTSASSQGPDGAGSGPGADTGDAGTDGGAGTDPADDSLPEATEDDGLEGMWEDSYGNVYEFVEERPGTYAITGPDVCGGTTTTEFTGSDGTYSATVPLYDVSTGTCEVIGQARQTITVDADGESAEVLTEQLSGAERGVECFSCGTMYLTRL